MTSHRVVGKNGQMLERIFTDRFDSGMGGENGSRAAIWPTFCQRNYRYILYLRNVVRFVRENHMDIPGGRIRSQPEESGGFLARIVGEIEPCGALHIGHRGATQA